MYVCNRYENALQNKDNKYFGHLIKINLQKYCFSVKNILNIAEPLNSRKKI